VGRSRGPGRVNLALTILMEGFSRLKAPDIDPLSCAFDMVAVGPIHPEQSCKEEHTPCWNDVVAAERQLAQLLQQRGYDVIGKSYYKAKGNPGTVEQASGDTICNSRPLPGTPMQGFRLPGTASGLKGTPYSIIELLPDFGDTILNYRLTSVLPVLRGHHNQLWEFLGIPNSGDTISNYEAQI
jgi:hypothetical protein